MDTVAKILEEFDKSSNELIDPAVINKVFAAFNATEVSSSDSHGKFIRDLL